MYAAKIELGWTNQWFKGETPLEIMEEVEKYQDFHCLLQMGRMKENKNGQQELDKLELFLEKYYEGNLTMEDIKELEVRLSIGNIVCHGILMGQEANDIE